MPAPKHSDEVVAAQIRTRGIAGAAQYLGVTERAMHARRRNIEGKWGQPIESPFRLQPKETGGKARLHTKVKDGIVIVGSDPHYWPGIISTAHAGLVRFCEDLKPDVVVMDGDVVDGAKVSRHARIGWDYRPDFADELEAVQLRLGEIEKASGKAKKFWPLGNHDCLDAETECLTRRGWVAHDDIRADDEVFSLDVDSIKPEWTRVDEIVRYPFDGELVCVEKRSISMAVTPNHRVLGYKFNWRTNRYDQLLYHRAGEMLHSMDIPVSGQVEQSEYSLTDDELRLAGWVLTDGCFGPYDLSIYQSKPESSAEIAELLGRLGYEYSLYTRDRKVASVCGRDLVKDCLPQNQFFIRAESSKLIKEWLPSKEMPGWVWHLSARQFQVFLEAVVAGDGSWDGAKDGRCAVVHGKPEFLSDLQAVCVQHGWRSRISVDPRGASRLNLAKRPNMRIEKGCVSRESYKGTVWCLRVPHGNFMVRRRGSAYFTGNSRMETLIANKLPEMERVQGVHLKDHFDKCWNPCWSLWINDEVVVKHRFKGGMHADRNNTLNAGKHVVTGHLHQGKYEPLPDYNGVRFGVSLPWMGENYGPQTVDYTEDNPVQWRSGFCVLTFIDGELCEPEFAIAKDVGVVEFRGSRIKV